MKKVLLAISIFTSAISFAQTTKYDGNLKSGFGGSIGQGFFEVTDKGDSVCFLLTKGVATFDSVLVFYVDGIDGGISTTANLAAGTDIYTTAVTGNYSPTQKSVLNFSAGFQPDFSVVFNKDGGKIYFFEKDTQGNDIIMPGADVVLTPMGSNASPTYSGTIAKADVSVSGPVSFKLLGTYISDKAFRSNEGFGDDFTTFDNANGYTSYQTRNYLNYSSVAALPVTFVDLKASIVSGKVQVKWTVAQEVNVDEYEIQRSSNGRQFSTIATIRAQNLSTTTTYSTFDNTAATGTNYYRIVIKEKGRSEISKVVSVKGTSGRNVLKVQQLADKLNLKLSGLSAGVYTLSIVNNNGQLFQLETIQHDGGETTKQISLKSNVVKGIYRVVLQSGNTKITQSILLQ